MDKCEVTSIYKIIGKSIAKVCYCEPTDVKSPVHFYLEFDDGSHFEMYTNQEIHFCKIIENNEEIGSVVDRIFDLALKNETIVAKADRSSYIKFSDETKKYLK